MCHQVVLSAGSKRFANMLEQGNLHGEELPVWGVDSDALESIISFFYSAECTLSYPGAVAVLDAATRLDVPALAAAAEEFIRETTHPTTVTTILTQSLQFKMSELAATCFDYINNRWVDVWQWVDVRYIHVGKCVWQSVLANQMQCSCVPAKAHRV
jgi:hypothetical protein